MVKIEERSPEEIREEERFSKLVEIAKGVLPSHYDVDIVRGAFSFGVYEKGDYLFNVDPTSNLIRANSHYALGYAVALAERYEALGEPEFTVKKDYSDGKKIGEHCCGTDGPPEFELDDFKLDDYS